MLKVKKPSFFPVPGLFFEPHLAGEREREKHQKLRTLRSYAMTETSELRSGIDESTAGICSREGKGTKRVVTPTLSRFPIPIPSNVSGPHETSAEFLFGELKELRRKEHDNVTRIRNEMEIFLF